GRQYQPEGPLRDVPGGLGRRPETRRRASPPASGGEQGGVLRHQPDPDEIHGEEARHHHRQRAPPADGAGDPGAGETARRRAGPDGFRLMRLVSFEAEGRTSYGAVTEDGSGVVDLG